MSNQLKTQESLLRASAKELLHTDLLHQSQSQIFQHVEYPKDSYVISRWIPSFTSSYALERSISGKNSRYTLYDLVTQKTSEFHETFSAMKPFLFDPSITNPLDVARRDHMEYSVEDILDHRGKHQRTHIEFSVKRLNYPSDKNTWEPYSSLRDVVKLHDYLRHNNMTKLINKHYC